MTDKLSTPTSQPPAAETRLAGDGLDHLTDDQWQDMLDAGQEALCQIRSITYFDDEEQEAIFRAMFATLTQPEPTAQQGGDEGAAHDLCHADGCSLAHIPLRLASCACAATGDGPAQQAAGEAE